MNGQKGPWANLSCFVCWDESQSRETLGSVVSSGKQSEGFADSTLTSSRSKGLSIFCGGSFQLCYLIPECLDVFLHEVTVIYGPEQDPALALALPLPTISATFRSTACWHSSSGRSSGWSEKRRKLDVTVPDSVSSFLLRHDMIQSFLWGRQLAFCLACGSFPCGITIWVCYDGRSGGDRGRRSREWRWDEWGMR